MTKKYINIKVLNTSTKGNSPINIYAANTPQVKDLLKAITTKPSIPIVKLGKKNDRMVYNLHKR